MLFILKKILFTLTLNSALFLLLIVGIQNSSSRNKVKFIIGESVSLPVSFIVGISFITGSIYGSFFSINLINIKKR
tara:strand:- start:265 stop:492 length:228 start_codon:yes stop_codon:yes gene_type:complete